MCIYNSYCKLLIAAEIIVNIKVVHSTAHATPFTLSLEWCYCIGFGLASHLGVLTGIPTIGVGKNMYFIDGMKKDDDFKQKVSMSILAI